MLSYLLRERQRDNHDQQEHNSMAWSALTIDRLDNLPECAENYDPNNSKDLSRPVFSFFEGLIQAVDECTKK